MDIAVKKMMVDYCVYCDGVLFGLICDNNFYLKVTESCRPLLKEVILRPPTMGRRTISTSAMWMTGST